MGGDITQKELEALTTGKINVGFGFVDRPCIPEKTVVFGPCAGNDHGEAKQEVSRPHEHTYMKTYLRSTSSMVGGESFEEALTKLLNRYSEERASNTPDFILAKFLLNALDTFNIAVQERERWYGRKTW